MSEFDSKSDGNNLNVFSTNFSLEDMNQYTDIYMIFIFT